MNLLLITLGSLALLALVAALVSKLTKGSQRRRPADPWRLFHL